MIIQVRRRPVLVGVRGIPHGALRVPGQVRGGRSRLGHGLPLLRDYQKLFAVLGTVPPAYFQQPAN